MTEIISYRLSATGIWGYSYYQNRLYIGETSCRIGRSSSVRITGEDISWYSPFSIDTDIVPGISRRVNDDRNARELYRVIFWQPGLYELIAKAENGETWSMIVQERNNMFLFGQQGMPVSAITERIGEAEWLPPTAMQIEPAFRTSFFDREDSPGFLMMVLSFPALKMI